MKMDFIHQSSPTEESSSDLDLSCSLSSDDNILEKLDQIISDIRLVKEQINELKQFIDGRFK